MTDVSSIKLIKLNTTLTVFSFILIFKICFNSFYIVLLKFLLILLLKLKEKLYYVCFKINKFSENYVFS